MSIFNIIRLIILAAIVASCTGCAIITHTGTEGDARKCHRDAYTVAAMTKCSEAYPQHNGTLSDIVSQPIGSLERVLIQR